MNTPSFEEFKKSIQGLHNHRKYKVRGSLGVYDAYKWIRKRKWVDIGKSITEHEFYSIIRRVNNYLADSLVQGNDITFPHRMGNLELRKFDSTIRLDNGKVKTNLPVDWKSTIKLWYEDEESFNNRTLVRLKEKEIFKVYYNKRKADYNNQVFYEFKVNREVKRRLKENIKKGKIDAFKLSV